MSQKFVILFVSPDKNLALAIEKTLSHNFNTVHASNGRAGIMLAMEIIPDMIISDYMMTEKNGLQFCNAVKFDVRTQDIPFILLTSQNLEHFRTTGIEEDPDLVIEHPFDLQDIESAVDRLLEISISNRKRNNEWLSSNVKLKMDDDGSQFSELVKQLFDEHLLDIDFNVDKFSELINMSRMQLYRKTKAMFNQSPSALIKKRRLIHAANLLKTTSKSISEIAYESGFSQPAYFAKCFKKQYEISPNNYRK